MLPVLQQLGEKSLLTVSSWCFIFNKPTHYGVSSVIMAAGGRDAQGQMSQIQRQIQQDWANREYIELMTCSIKKITDFLNAFGV